MNPKCEESYFPFQITLNCSTQFWASNTLHILHNSLGIICNSFLSIIQVQCVTASDLIWLRVNKHLVNICRFLTGLGFRSLMPVLNGILHSSGLIHPDRELIGLWGDFDKFHMIYSHMVSVNTVLHRHEPVPYSSVLDTFIPY